MPLSYAFCRRLCREAERCEPILRAFEVYEDTWGRHAPARLAQFIESGAQPACFVRKSKDRSANPGKAG